MIALVRKNLGILILKHPVSFHFSSNSTGTEIGISPTVVDILRNKYDFPLELTSRVASELNRLKTPEKADSILSFFKESGFSNSDLQKIVKYRPSLLASSLEDRVRPKIKIFQDLGFPSDDICKIISNNPGILCLSLNANIIPSLSVLKGLLGSDSLVARIVRRSPRFVTVSCENTLLVNVEFLKSCGVPLDRIRTVLHSYPSSFLHRPEVMRKSAEKAKEMGLDSSSKSFVYAIITIVSFGEETWELKLQAYRDLGFSDNDISTMFGKKPVVFLVSIEKVKKIKEFLLASGKFNLSCIVNSPSSLMCSFEKRLKPRLQVLAVLESRNLIEKWPSLGTFCKLADAQFFERFVRPYANEVDDLDITKRSF